MGVTAFLNTKESNKKLNKYKIVVKSLRIDGKKVITALGVPKISTDITKQSGCLQNLQLANQGHSKSSNINLLIGFDIYWEFVTGQIKRDSICTLVAQKSIFGYLVSGLLTKTISSKPKNVSHGMKIIFKQENCLNEKINQFWNIDTIVISHKKTTMYEKSIDNIKFKNDRFSVALPFKENRPMF